MIKVRFFCQSNKLSLTRIGLNLGRLTKDDIDRMVKEAEQYKQDDDKQRDRISAKNGLESYAFNMKSTVEDEKLKVISMSTFSD